MEDEDRLRALWQAHSRPVLGYILRRCANEADAHDVLADTFVVAWRRIDAMPPADAALPWLYAVARRTLANHRRSERRREQLSDRLRARSCDAQIEPASQPEADALARADHRTALVALSRLRPSDQEVLRLAAWEGLPHGEIAQMLGCSANAAALRLYRARRRFTKVYWKESQASRTPKGMKEANKMEGS
jgi:RNA polymerase sigma-70 factor (ECF subfamily)